MPEFIEIDVSNAQLNDIVHLSQVKLPEGVELTSVVHSHEDDLPVVSLAKPKRVVEEEEVAETDAAAVPTEAKGKEKDA